MDLADITVNPDAIEQGEWVERIPDMGDLRLKTRGVDNVDWRRLQAKLIRELPRNKRVDGMIDAIEQDRINAILLRDAGLQDWGNFTRGGEPVPFSKELAYEFLTDPKYRDFFNAAMWSAQRVGRLARKDGEDQAKN